MPFEQKACTSSRDPVTIIEPDTPTGPSGYAWEFVLQNKKIQPNLIVRRVLTHASA
jgi:hypothetical protein